MFRSSSQQPRKHADKPRRSRRNFLPRFENLENRLAPATLTWVGDVNNGWGASSGGNTNWSGNDLPQNGDDLLFPLNAQNRSNQNNFTGLQLNSITLVGTDYVISGNAVTLAAAGIVDVSANGINTLFLGVNLTADDTKLETAQASSALTLSGTLNLNGFQPKIGGVGNVRILGSK